MHPVNRGGRDTGRAGPPQEDGAADAESLIARLTELLREITEMRREAPPWLEPSLTRAAEGVGDALTILILRAQIEAPQKRVPRRRSPLADEPLRKHEKEEAL